MKIIVLVFWHSHFKTTIVWHVWNALAGFYTKSIYEGSKRLKNHVSHLLHQLVKVTCEGSKTLVRSPDAPSLQILNQFCLVAFLSSFLSMLHLFWSETACYHKSRPSNLHFFILPHHRKSLTTCRNLPISMTGCRLKMSSSLHSSNRHLKENDIKKKKNTQTTQMNLCSPFNLVTLKLVQQGVRILGAGMPGIFLPGTFSFSLLS